MPISVAFVLNNIFQTKLCNKQRREESEKKLKQFLIFLWKKNSRAILRLKSEVALESLCAGGKKKFSRINEFLCFLCGSETPEVIFENIYNLEKNKKVFVVRF